MNARTVNMSAKDIFNAKSSSKAVKDYIGVNLIVAGASATTVVDPDTGDVKDIGYISTNEGVFGFTSAVILATFDDFMNYLETTTSNNEECVIRFNENKSNSGKTFYSIEIC